MQQQSSFDVKWIWASPGSTSRIENVLARSIFGSLSVRNVGRENNLSKPFSLFVSADLCWQICSHDYLKAAFVGEVSSSDILSLCSLDWLRVKAEEESSDINHSSSMPRGCHQPAHCNLIKMGKERIVCVLECVHVWVDVECVCVWGGVMRLGMGSWFLEGNGLGYEVSVKYCVFSDLSCISGMSGI